MALGEWTMFGLGSAFLLYALAMVWTVCRRGRRILKVRPGERRLYPFKDRTLWVFPVVAAGIIPLAVYKFVTASAPSEAAPGGAPAMWTGLALFAIASVTAAMLGSIASGLMTKLERGAEGG